MLENVETGSGEFRPLKHAHQGVLVEQFAARGVHHNGVGAQMLEPAGDRR